MTKARILAAEFDRLASSAKSFKIVVSSDCKLKNKTNVELLSIYIGNWPAFIGKSHTNECLISKQLHKLSKLRESAGVVSGEFADKCSGKDRIISTQSFTTITTISKSCFVI